MESADVIIVGAGITGLTAALFLRRSGTADRVTVLDPLGAGQGQTAVQPGGVRQQWSTEVHCRMARFGYRFYRQAADELDEPRLHLAEGGYLFLHHDDAQRRAMAAAAAMQRGLGIPTETVPAEELWRRFPFLHPSTDVTGAVFLQQDGYFDDAGLVVASVARAALRLGVAVRTERVLRLIADHGRMQGVETAQARHAAPVVILAAGRGSRELAATVGVDLPIASEPRFLLYSRPLPGRVFEPLVVSARDGVAVKQLASGGLLASDLRGTDRTRVNDWREAIRSFGRRLLPRIQDVPLPRLVEGHYDSTPDHHAIVGPAGPGGLHVAAGMSGHGFMMAPAVAQTLTAQLSGQQTPGWPLEALSLGRFARGATAEREQRII